MNIVILLESIAIFLSCSSMMTSISKLFYIHCQFIHFVTLSINILNKTFYFISFRFPPPLRYIPGKRKIGITFHRKCHNFSQETCILNCIKSPKSRGLRPRPIFYSGRFYRWGASPVSNGVNLINHGRVETYRIPGPGPLTG